MKERGHKILQELLNEEERSFNKDWKSSKWSKVNSFVEMGIPSKSLIISLWGDHGNLGEEYTSYLKSKGVSYDEQQYFWGIMTLFSGDVGYSAKIEDFLDISVSDLDGLRSYDKMQIKILERVFSSSTK